MNGVIKPISLQILYMVVKLFLWIDNIYHEMEDKKQKNWEENIFGL